jgi:AraC-like DNA-binding protein
MDGPEPDFGLLTFDSRTWPTSVRTDAWRDILNRTLIQAEFDPIAPAPYDVYASVRVLPEMRFGLGTLGASRYIRKRRIVASDNDDIFMLVNLDGAFSVSQRGREFSLRAGDANIITCAEESIYVRPTPGRIRVLRVPRTAFASRVANLDDRILGIVPFESEALQLLVHYLRALDGQQPLHAPALRERVSAHMCDLLALALGVSEKNDAIVGRGSVLSARMVAIKAHIGANLHRRDLSLAAISQRMRLTERQIQRLFEAEGTTFTHYLLERRLKQVFDALGDQGKAARSVSELALEGGFGDISYFNRAFRRRFGMTPSDARRSRTN